MARFQIDMDRDTSLVVASGIGIPSTLQRHFNYELSDKKVKSNFLKAAAREAFEVEEKQLCTMINLSVGSYLEVVIPTVIHWNNSVNEHRKDDIEVQEVLSSYDEQGKHVESVVRFRFKGEKITVTCYYTTQRIKIEGKGYAAFVSSFLQPLFLGKIAQVSPGRIDRINKEVIASLTGKKKVVSRPTRSVKYKTKTISCDNCEMQFTSNAQLKKHMKIKHTKGHLSKTPISIPMVDNISFLDTSVEETITNNEHITLKEATPYKVVSEASKEAETTKVISSLTKPCSIIEVVDLSCRKCNFETEEHGQLQNHINSCHENSISVEESVKCSLCNFETSDTVRMNDHTKSHYTQSLTTTAQITHPVQVNESETPTQTSPCPFCELASKNNQELKIHIANIHLDEKLKQNNIQDNIHIEASETCSTCPKCPFIGNKHEMKKHQETSHAKKHSCEICGETFVDEKQVRDHIRTMHTTKSSIEPFPCDKCGLVLATFPLLQSHSMEHQKSVELKCKFCDYVSNTENAIHDHLVEAHEEYVLLHSMSKQMDDMSARLDKVPGLENTQSQMVRILLSILDNQNAMKQELFVIRNIIESNTVHSSRKAEPTGSSSPVPPPCPPSRPVSPQPSPPPRTVSPPSCSPPIPAIPTPDASASTPRPHPRSPRSSTPGRSQSLPSGDPKILFIGDSISSHADYDRLQVATQAQFVKAKAYSSAHDTEVNIAKQAAKFPHLNFSDVVPEQLKKDDFQYLIIQAGSVDITNLNTMENPQEYFDYFQQETIVSATTLFETGEKAVVDYPNLQKVVIMNLIPRYDKAEVDPLSLKSALSLLFNQTLTNLWMKSTHKQNMHIGTHSIECSGAIRESWYRHTKTSPWELW